MYQHKIDVLGGAVCGNIERFRAGDLLRPSCEKSLKHHLAGAKKWPSGSFIFLPVSQTGRNSSTSAVGNLLSCVLKNTAWRAIKHGGRESEGLRGGI